MNKNEFYYREAKMNNILSEKEYQKYIIERLEKDNGYTVRSAKKYDRLFAMDREMLFKFLDNTQPEAMEALRKVYKDDLEETLVNYINSEMTKKGSCLISVLKHGIEVSVNVMPGINAKLRSLDCLL